MWLITVFKEDVNNLFKFNQSWQYNTCLGVFGCWEYLILRVHGSKFFPKRGFKDVTSGICNPVARPERSKSILGLFPIPRCIIFRFHFVFFSLCQQVVFFSHRMILKAAYCLLPNLTKVFQGLRTSMMIANQTFNILHTIFRSNKFPIFKQRN